MANITRPEFLHSLTLGELLRWQKHTTDNIQRVSEPQNSRCSVYRAAAYAVPSGVNDPIPFDTTINSAEELALSSLDQGGYGVLCKRAGYVLVVYSFETVADSTGTYRKSYLGRARTLTAEILGRTSMDPPAATWGVNGSGILEVVAGDVVQAVIQHDNGGTLALSVANSKRCRMDVTYLSFT